MIGLDTSFLVAWAIPEHPEHETCRRLSLKAAAARRTFGLTPGLLAEFMHVITDPRRFARPLDMAAATSLANFWSNAAEVSFLPQKEEVTRLWLDWLTQHQLGRKRLLDTLIAATWHVAGIREIYTLHPSDFTIFNQFTASPRPPEIP
jgi:predicted nucleic acid-binding protein